MTSEGCWPRMRAQAALQLLCGVATMVLAMACGARSPLDLSDGGSGGGFEPDALVAGDGDLSNRPSQGSPPGLTLPGASFRDASACYECETNSSGPTPTPTGDASPVPVQTAGSGFSIQNGECSSTVEATGDGGSYQILCSCPAGACTCFGPTTKVVTFIGCPSSCPTGTEAVSLCGWSLAN
jgi:hypothetical protein